MEGARHGGVTTGQTQEAPTMTDEIRDLNDDHDPETPGAGFVAPGEYAPAGEGQGAGATFAAEQLADTFRVRIGRVHDAMRGEYGLDPGGRVTSKQAHDLLEALLPEAPLEQREAMLMELGAFTPRRDEERGIGESSPTEVRARNRADFADAGDADGASEER
jgi:hypothetical protein